MTAQSSITTQILSRPFQGVDDHTRVRRFLQDTYRLTGKYHNWEIRRWEGQWYWGKLDKNLAWGEHVRLWETESGQLVGVAHTEGGLGNAWFEIHPDYRHLEDEMLTWAEAHLAAPNQEGRQQLVTEAYDYDVSRQAMLARRGYKALGEYGYLRWRPAAATIPDVVVPEGYIVRSLKRGEWRDTTGWLAVISAVFSHVKAIPNDIAVFQSSPIYRHDLHLVAEAPDGSFAAFAGLTVDEVSRTAIFEPVGTHPDHRRRHLAQAVMVEGLRRLRAFDIETVYVGTGEMIPANGLYESLGFTNHHRSQTWRKLF
ncbi:MAG: GNAT family N-acetyltransferase [Anaerolineaceae bacterium]|nr:GNAT family N-acetyltransferase [Anaerolineaceae bacterium]